MLTAIMVDTAERYRLFCLKLLQAGVAQKTIGVHARHGSGWASKWLKRNEGQLSIAGMDQLARFFDDLAALLEQRPNRRAAIGTRPAHVEVLTHAKTDTDLEQSTVPAAAALVELGERVRSSRTKDHQETLTALFDGPRRKAPRRAARRRAAARQGDKSPARRRKAR